MSGAKGFPDPAASRRPSKVLLLRGAQRRIWSLQGLGEDFWACVRLRACVRPIDAAEAAGQDGFRRREIQTIQRPRSAVASRGLSPVADRTIPSIFLSVASSAKASPNVVSNPPISSGGCDSSAASLRVNLATYHQFPGDPRHFVGERDRRELGGLALQERQHPAGWVLRSAPAGLPDHGGRAHDQAAAQHRIAGAGDAPGPRFAGGRMVARRQPKPGGEVASRLEQMRFGAFITRSEAISRPTPGIAVKRRATSFLACQSRRRRLSARSARTGPHALPRALRKLARQRRDVGSRQTLKEGLDRRRPLGGDEAKLGPMTADRIYELRALAHQPIALARKHQGCLLIGRFGGTKRTCGRLAASHSAAASAASFLPRAT